MKTPIFRAAPWHQTNWDIRAAGNFIGGGSGTGLLLAAASSAVSGAGYLWPALLALAFVALGLACVWLEIGQPFRALNVFFHPQTSWMTREAMVAPLLFASALAAILFGGPWPWIAASTGMLFVYCQGRILRAAKGIPAWRQPFVVPLIVVTAIAEGAGWMLAVAPVLNPPVALPGLAGAACVLLLARALVWRAYLDQFAGGGAPQAAIRVFAKFDKPFLAVANGIPTLFLVAAYLGASSWFAALGGLMMALGGWALKYTLVTKAAYNQGFALPKLPVRGSGAPMSGTKPGWKEGER